MLWFKSPKKQECEAEMKWPNTTAPNKDGTGCYGCNINGTPYKKEEVEPNKWQWVVDKASQKREWEYQARKNKLGIDLQTRVLSEYEMAEVSGHGYHLFVTPMVPYSELDKQRQFNEAMCQQHRLRAIAKGVNTNRGD